VRETRKPEPRAAVHGGTGRALTVPSRADDALQPARVVDPRGRAKVFRPLPAEEREAAVARGLAAYARGDFYLAHEELEPAWMGTADPGERELLGGLIKVAAAFVHASRGNPAGARTNLRGARERLAGAVAAGRDGGFDVEGLLAAIDDRLAQLDAESTEIASAGAGSADAGSAGAGSAETPPAGPVPDPPHDVAGPPGRSHRPPLILEPPAIARGVPG
jgi:predicted metal-dependent hydrolase